MYLTETVPLIKLMNLSQMFPSMNLFQSNFLQEFGSLNPKRSKVCKSKGRQLLI